MALGDGTTWDETLPTTATLVTVGPSHIVDVRAGVRSRMALEHEWPSSQSVTSAAGVHKFMTLQAQTAAPTIAGTQVAVVYVDTISPNRLHFNNGTDFPISQPLTASIAYGNDTGVHLASSDGLFTVFATSNSTLISIINDSGASPSATVAKAQGIQPFCCAMVRKGSYYQCNVNNGAPATVNFYPIGI